MPKNVKSQFNYVINSNFKEGMDKHSYKIENGREMDTKIFSYTSRHNLMDISKNFANFLKENFTEVKFIKDISPEMVQAFLNEKAQNCTKNTIIAYSNAMFKLELMSEKTFNIKNLNWRENVEIPKAEREKSESRGVESVISKEDLDKILNYIKEHKGQCGYAVMLQSFLGIRVQEIVSIKREDVKLEENKLVISNAKGGKTFARDLTEEQKEKIKEILDQNFDKNKLFSIKSESVNDYLRVVEDKLNLERHSFHDIRRYVAQNFYDNCRKEGDTKEEATKKTSIFLNHGPNREAMLRECYIKIR